MKLISRDMRIAHARTHTLTFIQSHAEIFRIE